MYFHEDILLLNHGGMILVTARQLARPGRFFYVFSDDIMPQPNTVETIFTAEQLNMNERFTYQFTQTVFLEKEVVRILKLMRSSVYLCDLSLISRSSFMNSYSQCILVFRPHLLKLCSWKKSLTVFLNLLLCFLV